MAKITVFPRTLWSASSLFALEKRPVLVLVLSLCLLGIGDGLIVLANFGSSPWTVLAQGIAFQSHISVGWASFMISCVVMLMWFPLKLKPGFGTILNIFLIALALGLTTAYIAPPVTLSSRSLYIFIGILLYGIGSAFYLTCHQGAGPRDGLMVGLCRYFNWNVGIVRTLMEASVCFFGFLLGGIVGVGTLIFAFSIGWVIQFTLQLILFFHQQKR
ncbi:YczE/YyaS/YitT family protein [Actinobacillus seminis]|uniref:membrane protein YczE n=1 Tax=Actinobacillus seminis TaxID=722 RepID=UPI003B93043E